ncbi:28S ribosomal protein S17, mitochondrial-like [Cyprinus carpio]|uniref:28S ribosomal protein S17, mitochondrial-like n=1 Tax=Cyprinus carpio TaxID=7962 RepID=A0A9Q9VAJ0_CYPCA|nr:28S ribosomal protein S17, mitochondrial-like [Cyprinus carpio]
MSTRQASVHAKWIIGQVIGTKMKKTAKVRVTRLVLDPYLLKALPEKRSKHVNRELAEIVYKVGQVVDPLTGKRVAGTQYLEPLTESTEDTEVSLKEKLEQLNITASTTPPSAS